MLNVEAKEFVLSFPRKFTAHGWSFYTIVNTWEEEALSIEKIQLNARDRGCQGRDLQYQGLRNSSTS